MDFFCRFLVKKKKKDNNLDFFIIAVLIKLGWVFLKLDDNSYSCKMSA